MKALERLSTEKGPQSHPYYAELHPKPIEIPFSLKSKGKLSPRLYSIQFERKQKFILCYIFFVNNLSLTFFLTKNVKLLLFI